MMCDGLRTEFLQGLNPELLDPNITLTHPQWQGLEAHNVLRRWRWVMGYVNDLASCHQGFNTP